MPWGAYYRGNVIFSSCSHYSATPRLIFYFSRKVLEVYLPPGTEHGDVFTFQGEGSTLTLDDPAGDVSVRVISSPEDKSGIEIESLAVQFFFLDDLPTNLYLGWTRKGSDLYCQVQIPLVDALTGFEMWVSHVSGDSLCIENPPGRVLKPGDVKQIECAGMPTKGFVLSIFNHTHGIGSLFL